MNFSFYCFLFRGVGVFTGDYRWKSWIIHKMQNEEGQNLIHSEELHLNKTNEYSFLKL